MTLNGRLGLRCGWRLGRALKQSLGLGLSGGWVVCQRALLLLLPRLVVNRRWIPPRRLEVSALVWVSLCYVSAYPARLLWPGRVCVEFGGLVAGPRGSAGWPAGAEQQQPCWEGVTNQASSRRTAPMISLTEARLRRVCGSLALAALVVGAQASTVGGAELPQALELQ